MTRNTHNAWLVFITSLVFLAIQAMATKGTPRAPENPWDMPHFVAPPVPRFVEEKRRRQKDSNPKNPNPQTQTRTNRNVGKEPTEGEEMNLCSVCGQPSGQETRHAPGRCPASRNRVKGGKNRRKKRNRRFKQFSK